MKINDFADEHEHGKSTFSVCMCCILFVPVVDLMDVAKHYFVLPFHVIRDALLLHPAHVALQTETHKNNHELKLLSKKKKKKERNDLIYC